MAETEEIKIGKYLISMSKKTPKRKIIIYNTDGEGGTFSEKKLKKCLDRFWKENF
mgnify:CR=1 FL=1